MTDLPEEPSALSPIPPTSDLIAVAIEGSKNDPLAMAKVVASGRGALAEQILALAFAKGIKVRTDADLAELLVTLDIDSPIPTEAVIAVAEILIKVYEVNGLLSSAATPMENAS